MSVNAAARLEGGAFPLTLGLVSKKSAKIAELIAGCRGGPLPAHYLGYFRCFNEGLYYEAHDVLEEMWLPIRKEPAGDFYKGLIQLAGAFVHLQKNRLKPSAALFRLAENNLLKYRSPHCSLQLEPVLELIRDWLAQLERSDYSINPLTDAQPPELSERWLAL